IPVKNRGLKLFILRIVGPALPAGIGWAAGDRALWSGSHGRTAGSVGPTLRFPSSPLVGIGANDFSPVARGDGLVDADLGPRRESERQAGLRNPERVARLRIERPGTDRLLDEVDRPVTEEEVGPAGMEAAEGQEEGVEPGRAGDAIIGVLDSFLDIHG